MENRVVLKNHHGETVPMPSVRKASHVLSTADEDRDGDVLDLAGWDLASYIRNPIVLWAHDSKAPPVGKGERVGVVKGALRSVTVFPEPGVYPFADQVAGLVLGGFLRGTSVGFNPVKASPRRSKGMNYQRMELLEYSILPVPSNREALVDATSKGIKLDLVMPWLEAFADDGASIILSRDERDMVQKGLLALGLRSHVYVKAAHTWRTDPHSPAEERQQTGRLLDTIRDVAADAARLALRVTGGSVEAATDAVAEVNRTAASMLAGTKAQLEAQAAERDTFAFVEGERISRADIQREVSHQVWYATHNSKPMASPAQSHRLGELSGEEIEARRRSGE